MTEERRYSEDEIRAAFWRVFHESGEHFFPYPAVEADSQQRGEATHEAWLDFVGALQRGEP